MQRGQFFCSKEGMNNGVSWFAAWPLHSPLVPEYGQWTWLSMRVRSERFCERYPNEPKYRVRFIRQLTTAEVTDVTAQYMVWGEKVPDYPWALVAGRLGTGSRHSYVDFATSDSTRSVGV